MKMQLNRVARACVTSVISASMVGGCAIKQGMDDNTTGAKAIEKMAVDAKARTQENVKAGAIVRVDRPRIGGREFRVVVDELPPVFNRKISYQTLGAQTLEEVIRAASAMTGAQIRMVEAFDADASGAGAVAGSGSSASVASYATQKVTFQVNGTFKDLLNEVANLLDISWRYNKATDTVEYFRFCLLYTSPSPRDS